ncbi:MAG TPA: heavy metal translocating P-type ATPase [Anaerolineae bacterium]
MLEQTKEFETTEKIFRVTGMDCASCARQIESAVAKVDGVDTCRLNFTTETLRVQGKVDPDAVIGRVQELGYAAETLTNQSFGSLRTGSTHHQTKQLANQSTSLLRYLWRQRNTRLALLGALLILPGLIFHELLPGLGWHHPLFDITSVVAMLLAGYPIAVNAWRSLRVNREININVLMTLAAIGAVAIGVYTEAGLVMVLFAIGEALEGYTSARARDSIRSLMAIAPQEATVLRPCIDCHEHLGQNGYSGGPCPFCGQEEQRVPVAVLHVGDRIIAKPGERLPMDGRVISGVSSVNQAPITGESRLVEKMAGDQVYAGSINGEGTLEIEVTHLAADNTISRLIKMVEEAQERRAPAQRFVDRFARYYTPAVVALAALVAIVPPLFLGEPLWNPAAPTQGWLYRALALLVVACPCALVISTPVSIISAISNAAHSGVLIKGGAHLETLSRVRAIAFDKTGTLTKGQPAVVAVRSVHCEAPTGALCYDCDDVLALAHAVEQRSEHPLAQAIVDEAAQRGLQSYYPVANTVRAMTGRGVTGEVNGRQVTIGSHAHFDNEIPHPAHCQEVVAADAQGYTTMLVSADDDYVGYIAVADTVRESSQSAVSALKRLGVKALVMLTGDNEATAQSVAQQVGVTDVRANCLPQDKVGAVKALRGQYGNLAMVGDGINDAPALASASVGIAIGRTAQAMETADVVLMGNDLRQLPFALQLSRATMRTIRTNVALSLGIKFAFLLLVLLGLGTMWMAVLADMGTSLLVTLNGMRLLRRQFR